MLAQLDVLVFENWLQFFVVQQYLSYQMTYRQQICMKDTFSVVIIKCQAMVRTGSPSEMSSVAYKPRWASLSTPG